MERPEVIIIPSMFVMVSYICWLWAGTAQRRQRLKVISELNNKLLEKLGSVQDFSALLQSEAGARFLHNLASEPPVQRADPQRRILAAAQTGAVLTCLGAGLLLLSFFSPLASDKAWQAFNAIGVIALSLGIGFVMSAVIAYRLSERLGLLTRPAQPRAVEATSEV